MADEAKSYLSARGSQKKKRGYLPVRRSQRLSCLYHRNALSPKSHPFLKSQRCHPSFKSHPSPKRQRSHPSLKSQNSHPSPKSQRCHPPLKSQKSHPPLISQSSHLYYRCQRSRLSLRNFFFYLLLFYFPVSSYSQRVFTAGDFIMIENTFDSPLALSAVLWFSIFVLFSLEN